MKILELEIRNVRGLKDVKLKPNCKSLVVWGPNGSGKSGVVDALDFLLTGRITRLTGEGTKGISISKHGPHIDHKPEDAEVRATILLPQVSDPIELKRSMQKPAELVYDNKYEKYLKPIIELARQGQHILTRREILRYITAEPRTRAQEVLSLLNISDVEEIRQALVKVKNDLQRDVDSVKKTVDSHKSAISLLVGKRPFEVKSILEFANINRQVLGKGPVKVLSSAKLVEGIEHVPSASDESRQTTASLLSDLSKLINSITPSAIKQVVGEFTELLESVRKITSDAQLVHAMSHYELTKKGLELLDDTGSCPLCGTKWPKDKLRTEFETRLELGQSARKEWKVMKDFSQKINSTLDAEAVVLKKVSADMHKLDFTSHTKPLESWLKAITNLQGILVDPVAAYGNGLLTEARVRCALSPEGIEDALGKTVTAVKKKLPGSSPQEMAWESLIRLHENLKSLENTIKDLQESELACNRATVLSDQFLAARDDTLDDLYNRIREKFVSLYRKLHSEDEANFDASFKPEGAGLNLEVDFYGKGKYPPHALHSEGHQDSMGLCLFLALAEKLTHGILETVILDDVVMSVDSDHRKHICNLLTEGFPHTQFIITTHDRYWMNELKAERVVNTSEIVQFSDWNISTGPQVTYELDLWEKIEADLKLNKVEEAAAKLRRGLEQELSGVCDALHAEVRFRLDGRVELGDLLPAAVGRYKNLLKAAKNAAHSWGDDKSSTSIEELEKIRANIVNRSSMEQWAINPNVHYNNWATASPKEFGEVVAAFKDLCFMFRCLSCDTLLTLSKKGAGLASLSCSCGKISLNLQTKVRESTLDKVSH